MEDKKEQDNNDEEDGAKKAMQVLMDVARVDTMVTVVDANNFENYIGSTESLLQRWGNDDVQKKLIPDADQRKVAHLLINQIEFANVIIINKCDLVDNEFDDKMDEIEKDESLIFEEVYKPNDKLKRIAEICQKLSPKAKIIYSAFSEIELKSILNSKSFSFNQAALNPGWLKEIRDTANNEVPKDMVPETEEYGITSFVYRARKPFHPMKLHLFMMAKMMKGVYRAKGFFWIATRNDTCFDWNQAGELIDFEDGGNWFATIPEKDWSNLTPDAIAGIKKDFKGKYGDRRQEIVFIGDKLLMNKDELIKQLDFCLLNKDEMRWGPQGWIDKIDDPFELDFDDDDDEYEDDSEDSEEDSDDDDASISDIE